MERKNMLTLEIKNLKLNFYTYEGTVKALDGINLKVRKGEILGIVGETGCGKSVSAFTLLGLVPIPPAKIISGEVKFLLEEICPECKGKGCPKCNNEGKISICERCKGKGCEWCYGTGKKYIDLLAQTEKFMRLIRGGKIAMIFQEPMTALNPVYSTDFQVGESFLLHRQKELYSGAVATLEKKIQDSTQLPQKLKIPIYKLHKKICELGSANPSSIRLKLLSKVLPTFASFKKFVKKEASKNVLEMLREVRIPEPEAVLHQYPHELSGGMRQRVLIALALALKPHLLIADEPTTALDVTTQIQILKLLRELKRIYDATVIYITHDLAVIAEICDRVAVMYAGTIQEIGDVKEIFHNPIHPYTKGLLSSIPRPEEDRKELKTIPGMVPTLLRPVSGCRFHPRCKFAKKICSEKKPEFIEIKPGRWVACHLVS